MKTGIKFRPCNVGASEAHNKRDPKYCAAVEAKYGRTYFFDEFRPLNKSWKNPALKGVSLPSLLDQMKAIVKEKTGRAMQTKDRIRIDPKTGKEKVIAGSSPIREGVCPIKPDTRLEDFTPFAQWLSSKGVRLIRVDIHRDEGHLEDGVFQCNNHAHIVADFLDHQTGKSVKLSKADCEEMQTVLAKSLGMERGTPKELSGVEGLNAIEYKIEAETKRHQDLAKTNEQLAKDNQQLSDQNTQLQGENQELKKDSERLKLGNAVKESALGLFGQSSKDKQIKQLASENSQLKETTAKAIKDRDDALQKARNASKTAEERTIKEIVKQSGIGWPNWEGFSIYGLASKIKDLIETKNLWYQSNQRLERENEKLKRQLPSQDEDLRRGRGM